MTSFQTAAVVFWLCVAAIFYVYVGYPLLIWGLDRCCGGQRAAPELADRDLPSVSLLIAACIEEALSRSAYGVPS